MTSDVHGDDGPPEPAQLLLDATARVAPDWLRRVTLAAASRGGVTVAPGDAELEAVVASATDRLVADLGALLATDVDEQRTSPLSLFRDAVREPTRWLLARGARPASTDPFTADHFPDDVFGLGPARWSDVDPELHEPGIVWGAWKAMTVLRRRRAEGLR